MTNSSTIAPTFIAIIPAAGAGSRMNCSIPKQYLPCAGKTVLEHTLATLINEPRIKKICVVIDSVDRYWSQCEYATHPNVFTSHGGATRMLSVYNGLQAISKLNYQNIWAVVHDAARCLLNKEDLTACLDTATRHQSGVILAKSMTDTVKTLSDNEAGLIKTVPRESLWCAQTPQIFNQNNLLKAISKVISNNGLVTDEAQAMEDSGYPVKIVCAKHHNPKITTQDDLEFARMIIKKQKQREENELCC